MNREQIEKIIELLEAIRKSPKMHLGAVDVQLATVWIYAFYRGLGIFTDKTNLGFRFQVAKERGWKPGVAQPYSHQMQERGMTQEAIVEEMFTIEVEAWKRLAQKMDAQGKTGQ